MNYRDKLKAAKDRKDLARLLGYKPSALTSIIYVTPPERKYTTFEIAKKSGGIRTIKAPNPQLKKLQSHLAHYLYGCLAEIEEERQARPVSYGFRKTRTIASNAKNHKRRRYVLNIDIEDFFPSFNFGRVRGFFLKDKAFALKEQVATTIAQIACDGEALPQGSPCSPVISELIGQILDLRLLRIAKKHGVRYSRYADDITFSTSQRDFPEALAVQDSESLFGWAPGAELVHEIRRAGFKINPSKTRMHCRGSRQMVTGLVVNEKVNIRSEYYRKARAMCDSLFQSGTYFRSFTPPVSPGVDPQPDLTVNLNPLEGILSHIYAVTQSEDRRGIKDQRLKPRAIRTLYRRFLFYKYCIALDAPLIITEGKTDPIYLREAIRFREIFHPQLGEPGESGFKFAIRFFNYTGQAHEIIDLGGGTGDLKSIPLDYLRNFDARKRKPFQHVPMAYPVILVLDNDNGLESIGSTVRKNFGISITVDSTDDFYHITKNLYLIKTPETKEQSCIEDLFPAEWKNKRLNEKKFNPSGSIDTQTEYGKKMFAKYVVRPNSHKIDFSGFDPLLERIVAVLDHYSAEGKQSL
ncbi:MAG: RNA-directed DNA polymerase [Gammaproteobacteria bacterium]|nr:RNA-directed DNA polymerase [Gammaproteobacteria bacterium]MYF58968.1 RNA-directed DNA polymerase [Gammaproteobacteria bacterium]